MYARHCSTNMSFTYVTLHSLDYVTTNIIQLCSLAARMLYIQACITAKVHLELEVYAYTNVFHFFKLDC